MSARRRDDDTPKRRERSRDRERVRVIRTVNPSPDDDDDHHRTSRDRTSRERTHDRDRDRDRGRDRDRERDRDHGRDRDRERDRDRDRDRPRSSTQNDDRPHTSSRIPRSKRHRTDTFVSHWDELPDPNKPLPDPLQNLPQHPNAPKHKGTSSPNSHSNNDDSATRTARRLYLGNLQGQVSEDEVKQGWDQIMKYYFPDLVGANGCVNTVYINHEKKFAFLELSTMEETAAAMQLDQVHFRGQPLKVRRPMDFNQDMWPVIEAPPPAHGGVQSNPQQHNGGPAAGGVISNQVPDGPNKVFAGGLPYNLSEQEVKELLQAFGALKSFHLVRDKESNLSKGYGFFEYIEPDVTEAAVAGLNGIKIGDRTLTIRRAVPRDASAIGAAVPLTPAQLGQMAVMQTSIAQQLKPPSRVLVLTNMFEWHELANPDDYNDIKADVTAECGKYNTLLSTVLPRPGEAGAGKVFLLYDTPESAARIRAEVEGRQFGNNVVLADYMDEAAFFAGHLV